MASNFQLRVFPASLLPREPELLAAVQALVNACYNPGNRAKQRRRYESPDEIWQELGDDGVLAVIVDLGRSGAAVAVAGAKRWTPATHDYNENVAWQHWEIGPAASLNTPEYRKKGLVDRCLQALNDALLESEPRAPIKLWIKTVKDVNFAYWSKKGFAQVGDSLIVPKGMWDEDEEFIIVNMAKPLESGTMRE